ncbi:hypothetical protein TNCV_4973181 [Trichonephila clavipes]|nr:hypothetical protein TNCV_4973181 [Trichonephila clavipes]
MDIGDLVNINVALCSYTSDVVTGVTTSDDDDTRADNPSPNFYTTSTGGRLSLNPPPRRIFSGIRLKLVSHLPRVRYFDN